MKVHRDVPFPCDGSVRVAHFRSEQDILNLVGQIADLESMRCTASGSLDLASDVLAAVDALQRAVCKIRADSEHLEVGGFATSGHLEEHYHESSAYSDRFQPFAGFDGPCVGFCKSRSAYDADAVDPHGEAAITVDEYTGYVDYGHEDIWGSGSDVSRRSASTGSLAKSAISEVDDDEVGFGFGASDARQALFDIVDMVKPEGECRLLPPPVADAKLPARAGQED